MLRVLFYSLCFKIIWASESQRGMKPVLIVKSDVVKYLDLGFPVVLKPARGQSFRFEASEKSFCGGIVPAVPFAAHTGGHAILFQPLLVIMAVILAPPIGMMQQTGGGLSPPIGHGQGSLRELNSHVVLHGPAQDLPGKQVHDHGQIQPALQGPDIGDVRRPDPVGFWGFKATIQQIGGHGKGMAAVCRLVSPGSLDSQPQFPH